MEYLIKTENMLFECADKSIMRKKVNALLTLGISFNLFKNYDNEIKPVLIKTTDLLELKELK